MRYAFNAPTIWVHDMVIMLSAVCFVFGGAVASQRRNHIQMASYADRVVAACAPGARRDLSRAERALPRPCSSTGRCSSRSRRSTLMETSGRAWDVPIPAFLKAHARRRHRAHAGADAVAHPPSRAAGAPVAGDRRMSIEVLTHPDARRHHGAARASGCRSRSPPASSRASSRSPVRPGRADAHQQPHLQLHDRVRARLGADVHPDGVDPRALRRRARPVRRGARLGGRHSGRRRRGDHADGGADRRHHRRHRRRGHAARHRRAAPAVPAAATTASSPSAPSARAARSAR